LLLPAAPLHALFPAELWLPAHAALALLFLSAMLFVSLFAFCRRLSLFIAALAAMLLLSLVFNLVFPGAYRHAALFPAFLAMLLWLDRASAPSAFQSCRLASFMKWAQPVGSLCLFALFALQMFGTVQQFTNRYYGVPESRSADFAALVRRYPEFASSWIIADPDYLIEPVPYYLSNPVWRIREQQPGGFVNFTTRARLDITLDDVLATANMLRARSNKPVLILLATRLNQVREGRVREGIDWTLGVSPDSANRFLKATVRLAQYAPAASDESFDVYTLP
jgi:hypothetical protein